MTNKTETTDNLQKALQSIPKSIPSQGFSGQVLVRIKNETNLIKPTPDYLSTIKKVLIGGFVLMLIVFSSILLMNLKSVSFSITEPWKSFYYTTLFFAIGGFLLAIFNKYSSTKKLSNG